MSNYHRVPKNGERIRVTLEGVVKSADADGFYLNAPKWTAWVPHKSISSLDDLPDPLPTTPGSVIEHRTNTQRRYALANDGRWVSLVNPVLRFWADDFSPEDYLTRFDAGKA